MHSTQDVLGATHTSAMGYLKPVLFPRDVLETY
jgi:hypothetical protein